jgi:hypothetical protein
VGSEGLVCNVLSGDDPNDLVVVVDDDHMAKTKGAELTTRDRQTDSAEERERQSERGHRLVASGNGCTFMNHKV